MTSQPGPGAANKTIPTMTTINPATATPARQTC
jgi:hypothetical protein